jgi:hypothetical protein
MLACGGWSETMDVFSLAQHLFAIKLPNSNRLMWLQSSD